MKLLIGWLIFATACSMFDGGVHSDPFDEHTVDGGDGTVDCGSSGRPDECGSWTTVTGMPTARAELAATTGADGTIYAIGGTVDLSEWHPVAIVEAYTPGLDSWIELPPMPTARQWLGATTGTDGRIYAIGGQEVDGSVSAAVEAYTPSSQTWSSLAPLPTPRYGLAVATDSQGHIYAFNGIDSNNLETYLVEVYDPTTNTWSDNRPPTVFPRAFFGLATFGDNVILVGGIGDATLAQVSTFNVSEGNSSALNIPPMLTPRTDLAVAATDDDLFAIGGHLGDNTQGIDPDQVFATVEGVAGSAPNATWFVASSMQTARAGLAAATSGGTIYAIGGRTAVYDGLVATMETFTPPTAR